MSVLARVQECAAVVKAKAPGFQPAVALILGSGLGGFADTLTNKVVIPYEDLPTFPRSSVPGHAGRLVLGQRDGQNVMAMQGRVHFYEGYEPWQVAFPARVLCSFQPKVLVVTNAAGGINLNFVATYLKEFKIEEFAGLGEDDCAGQASCLNQISERERGIIGVLIDSLDDDGYLLQPLSELMEMLPAELGISLNDLQSALKYLQRLDPPGVGAHDLQECLVLQLQALPDSIAHRDQALRVVREYLKILASHDFIQIKKLLGCDDQSLRANQKLSINLNPKPDAEFSSQSERYIVPDVTVTKKNGVWAANLNIDAPVSACSSRSGDFRADHLWPT